jgi:TIR domain-containing protein
MVGQLAGRTFISYWRKDGGAAFAAELRKSLEKENLSVWQDIVALEGGRDWWSQIDDVLRRSATSARSSGSSPTGGLGTWPNGWATRRARR